MKSVVGHQVLDQDDITCLLQLSMPSVKVAEAHKPGNFDLTAANALWKRRHDLSIQHKLDGFRVQVFVRMLKDESFSIKVGTGSWKVLPNKQVVRDTVSGIEGIVNSSRVIDILKTLPEKERVIMFDGEIETYHNDAHGERAVDSFSTIQQKLTTEDATGIEFTYTLFDVVNKNPAVIANVHHTHNDPQQFKFNYYEDRFKLLKMLVSESTSGNIKLIEEVGRINSGDFESDEDLLEYVKGMYNDIFSNNQNLEGLVVWNLDSYYRSKRAGTRNPTLFKYKPFEDAEGVVMNVFPLQRNTAEAEIMPSGKSRKSNRIGDMVVDNERIGALEVMKADGTIFHLGVGFTDDQRVEFMKLHNSGSLKGRIVVFKHQVVGAKTLPRIPVYLGFREPIDMDVAKLEVLMMAVQEKCGEAA